MARGSTGNLTSALASFCVPGLGQLMQGRAVRGACYFLVAVVGWHHMLPFGLPTALLGLVTHVIPGAEAALWRGRTSPSP